MIPFFDEHVLRIDRVLTDRGTGYCGAHDRHEYELTLAVEDIDHTRTRTKSPQTNGVCERFHKTMLDAFYRVAFRKKVYRSIEDLQADPDEWTRHDNEACRAAHRDALAAARVAGRQGVPQQGALLGPTTAPGPSSAKCNTPGHSGGGRPSP